MSLRKPYAIQTIYFPVNFRFEILGLDSEFRIPQSPGCDQTSDDQQSQNFLPCIGQFMKKANGDMDHISRLHLTDIIPYLHTTPTFLNDVDLFHGIHMADEFFTRGNRGMGKKH